MIALQLEGTTEMQWTVRKVMINVQSVNLTQIKHIARTHEIISSIPSSVVVHIRSIAYYRSDDQPRFKIPLHSIKPQLTS